MATTLTQTHPLLSIPFSAATDFTELAGYCELFAETLLDSDDPALRMALCGRLCASITLLRSMLNDPPLRTIWPKASPLISFPRSPLALIPILACSATTILPWRSF